MTKDCGSPSSSVHIHGHTALGSVEELESSLKQRLEKEFQRQLQEKEEEWKNQMKEKDDTIALLRGEVHAERKKFAELTMQMKHVNTLLIPTCTSLDSMPLHHTDDAVVSVNDNQLKCTQSNTFSVRNHTVIKYLLCWVCLPSKPSFRMELYLLLYCRESIDCFNHTSCYFFITHSPQNM